MVGIVIGIKNIELYQVKPMCSKEVKETAYLTLVRPCLEYAPSVWDPYQLAIPNI